MQFRVWPRPSPFRARRYRGPMAAIALRLRAELRQRWPAWLGVALVAGIAGGVVLGLLAGAVRTRDAYRDFSRTMRAADAGRRRAQRLRPRRCGRPRRRRRAAAGADDGARQREPAVHRAHRRRSARRSGRPVPDAAGRRPPRARPRADASSARDGRPTPTRSTRRPPASCSPSGSGCTSASTIRLRFVRSAELPDRGGDAPEQLRRPPRRRARVVEQRDRRNSPTGPT